jgi:hypothetical protein
VSPIFVRPVREQLEHDRLIRFLQTKYKKKFDVGINVGDEQVAPLQIGQNTMFPDLVLMDGKRLGGVVEVESGESVNNLEAMAQWVQFSRARAPFHLYVPVSAFDVARRLCDANQVRPSEIWTYRPVLDGFDLVRGFHDPSASHSAPAPKSAANGAAPPARKAKPPAPKARPKPAKRPAVASRTKSAKSVRSGSAKGRKSAKKPTKKR